MQIKIHESYRLVAAICDTELLGKCFWEGKRILDVTESFYKGDEKSSDEARDIMKDLQKEDATFNIVGEKAIQTALEAGIIDKEGVLMIKGIPFALGLL
jgi:hypothetical protein